jgi:hypothetical protein
MKPMIILPPDVMDKEEIKKLNDNGMCVVVAKEPSKIKFVDPIPAASSRTHMENAAIALSRKLLNWPWEKNASIYKGTVAEMYITLLVEGTPLGANGTREEQEQQWIDVARREELAKIGREEARVEAAARKAARDKTKLKQ